MTTRLKTLWAAAAVAGAMSMSAMAAEPVGTVLVTGANRGIGLEYARQYAALGFKVIATARKPDEAADLKALAAADPKVVIEKLDVTDLAAIDELAAKYKGQPIDVLVNNAGITGDTSKQNFGSVDYSGFDDVMNTNVRGSLKMTEAFIDNVAASKQKKVVAVTSSEGSIAAVNSSRGLFYRASKAALNMTLRNVAFAIKPKGVALALINPGPVDTDMMKQARGRMPLRTPELAVRELIAVTDKLTVDTTGRYYNFDGTELPW